jgi:hypothetical protein
MAELISKVVRSSQRVDGQDTTSNPTVICSDLATRTDDASKMRNSHGYFPGSAERGSNVYPDKTDSHFPTSKSNMYSGDGIMKTVTTRMNTENHSYLEDSSSGETTVEESATV